MDMQNVSNLQIPEGAVRTIHDKDNRLIWGRLAYDTKYAGDTYQQTYSGTNFYNVKDVASASSSGVSVDDDGWITLAMNNTGSSTQYVNYFSKKLAVQTNTDYLIVVEIKDFTPGNNGALSIAGTSNTEQFKANSSLNISFSTMQKGVSTYIRKSVADFTGVTYGLRTTLVVSANTNRSVTFRISVLADTSITPETFVYEPFTGNIPAPNPDYPQPIQVVTGAQTVTVTGKNLFDGTYVNYAIGGGSGHGWFVNANCRSAVIRCLPNTKYSIKKFETSNRFVICDYPSYPTTTTEINLLLSDSTLSQATVTTHSDARYLFIFVSNQSAEPQMQLELSETPSTTYEPYQSQTYPVSLGSLELCKISDYQDYIYKSGDDWYVHKANQKEIYDGVGESWQLSTSDITMRIALNPAPVRGSSTNNPIIANQYVSRFSASINNSIFISGGADLLGIKDNVNATSYQDWGAWLASNNLIVYYALATPTDTKITDATLVGQLNAVHEWMTRYGYNATVTGNLPIIIDRTNL